MINAQALLQVEHLKVSLQNQVLLDDINISLAPNQIMAVIGPNGAGKTSLLRSICGDLALHSGAVTIFGRDFHAWSRRQLACRLSSLPQHSVLNFPFRVDEVVAMARLPHDSGMDADKKIVAHIMEGLDIAHLATRVYTQLSGGEKQRVQLARVIAQLYPIGDVEKLLVLDEPCTGLDLKHQKILAEMLRDLRSRGVSILLTVHDVNWAIAVSDSLLALKQGRVTAVGSVQGFLNNDALEQLFDVPVIIERGQSYSTVRWL